MEANNRRDFLKKAAFPHYWPLKAKMEVNSFSLRAKGRTAN